MEDSINIGELIKRGGIINSIDANTPFEVYEQLRTKMTLPQKVDRAFFYEGLCARERIMSTAVGR